MLLRLTILLLLSCCFIQQGCAQPQPDPLTKAWEYYRVRDFGPAMEYFNKALAKDSLLADAYFGRALIKEKQNNIEGANIDYTKAISIKPNPIYYNNRGLNYMLTEQYALAELSMREALKLDSSYHVAWMNLAANAYYQDKLEEACTFARKAKEQGNQQAADFIQQVCN